MSQVMARASQDAIIAEVLDELLEEFNLRLTCKVAENFGAAADEQPITVEVSSDASFSTSTVLGLEIAATVESDSAIRRITREKDFG